jgi:hypothetical protein
MLGGDTESFPEVKRSIPALEVNQAGKVVTAADLRVCDCDGWGPRRLSKPMRS